MHPHPPGKLPTDISDEQAKVYAFMRNFGQTVNLSPTVINMSHVAARFRIMQEELLELKRAMTVADMVETADALVDLLYTVYGTANSLGLNLRPFFHIVHERNMAKAWTHEQLPQMPDGSVAHQIGDNTYAVLLAGKVIKPPGFVPPDLLPELQRQSTPSPR